MIITYSAHRRLVALSWLENQYHQHCSIYFLQVLYCFQPNIGKWTISILVPAVLPIVGAHFLNSRFLPVANHVDDKIVIISNV